jgi:Ca2+-binding EF-hand superfamily protein
MFNYYDSDGGGTISVDEFKAAFAACEIDS